ncbi:hypothetical protein A8A01_13545 [Ewingella americana]|nr:hypothetical protein A8A01_13545 [Ewingella americana]
MFSILANLLKGINKGWLKDVLSGAGLTLGTAAASMIFINQLIDIFKGNLNSIPAGVLGIAHLAGFDYAISIVLGAIVTAAFQGAGKLSLRKK